MTKQIFQTDSTSRWNKFKWSMRIVFFIVVMLVTVFITMLIIDNIPTLPFRQDYRSVVTASRPFLKENKYSKEYKGFRGIIKEKDLHSNYAMEKAMVMKGLKRFKGSGDILRNKYIEKWTKNQAGIRSAFYVSWDPKSLFSLKQNINKLNLVIPEWFFINPNTDKLEVNIDPKGYNLMRKSGIPIMPILSNNFKQDFRPEGIGRILHNPNKRKTLINDVLNQCLSHKFIGINIDIENLNENSDEYLTAFVKELSQAFHAKDLFVTQDIQPFNTDYNLTELAKYNDYLFLMAYDEHMTMSSAGPISSQQWIEAAVDNLAKKVPEEKIVLGLGAYGYDWTDKGDNNISLSYRDALSTASDSESKIVFDPNTYNLSFAYQADNNIVHQVYFTDAATHFNTMRFGTEYGLAGFSVWRLGSEDNRLWQFYNKDMAHSMAARFRIGDLENLPGSDDVNYLGEGEVLDPLSTPHSGCVNIEMDNANILIASENYLSIPSSYQIRKFGKAGKKQLLLTFDDGPDETWTLKILD